MKYRTLGKTGYKVSEIGYGAWSLGGADWGNITDEQAFSTLTAVLDADINFIDTADVYGDGRSEKIIGEFRKNSKKKFYVATKLGRRVNPFVAQGYTKKTLVSFVERSLKNLQMDTLDLIQLHCPPSQVYYMPEVFEVMDDMVRQKMIRQYGVSVEKVEEALKALEYPGVATVQIIFNMFRQRPMEVFFKEAMKKNIGIIARVPLASGMLTGKITKETHFEKNDHRLFNRHGEMFDVGETFAGVDFQTGLSAVQKLQEIKPDNFSMSQLALRWILMQKAVSTVIAGGKKPEQVSENAKASQLSKLSPQIMKKVEIIYKQEIKPLVHQRW